MNTRRLVRRALPAALVFFVLGGAPAATAGPLCVEASYRVASLGGDAGQCTIPLKHMGELTFTHTQDAGPASLRVGLRIPAPV